MHGNIMPVNEKIKAFSISSSNEKPTRNQQNDAQLKRHAHRRLPSLTGPLKSETNDVYVRHKSNNSNHSAHNCDTILKKNNSAKSGRSEKSPSPHDHFSTQKRVSPTSYSPRNSQSALNCAKTSADTVRRDKAYSLQFFHVSTGSSSCSRSHSSTSIDAEHSTTTNSSLSASNYVLIGPTVDDGASYSSIGIDELNVIRHALIHMITSIDPKPSGWSRYEYLRFGGGAHASPSRKILGSVPIFVRTNSGSLASIRHLVIEGSSLWLIGRNVTRQCDILHIKTNKIRISGTPRADYIDMKDNEQHSHIDFSRFTRSGKRTPVMSSIISIPRNADVPVRKDGDFSLANNFIEKINNACDNSANFDFQTQHAQNRERNNVKDYLATVFANCNNCNFSTARDSIRMCTCTELKLIKYQF